jgi:hypothetical protein
MVSRVRTAPGVVEQVTVRCDVLEYLAPGDPPVVMPWYLKSTGAARQCFGRKKDGRQNEWLYTGFGVVMRTATTISPA